MELAGVVELERRSRLLISIFPSVAHGLHVKVVYSASVYPTFMSTRVTPITFQLACCFGESRNRVYVLVHFPS